jgi:hypothetical protein
MNEERELAISPIVVSSVQHNNQVSLVSWRTALCRNAYMYLTVATQVVSNIRNLTASLFGVAAGTLGFESYTGFIFYLVGSIIVSALIFTLRTEGKPADYFHRPLGDLWGGEVLGGLSSFVLTWTLFYGLVRA